MPLEVFHEVFQFVLRIAVEKQLVRGQTVGVDSTTLEANAAMKSILRRDTCEDWRGYVTRLMREEGAIGPDEEPSAEDVRRYEEDLYRYLETSHPGVLTSIAEKKALDDEVRGGLEAALKEFGKQFTAGRPAAGAAA